MRIKYGDREYATIDPRSQEAPLSDLAALQRETGWKLAEVNRMGELEMVSGQLLIFFTFRKNGQKISFSKAGDLLDEVEFLVDPGDTPDVEADPTPALTAPVQGDDAPTDETAS